MNKQKIIWLVLGMVVGVGVVLGGVYMRDYLRKEKIRNSNYHNPGIAPPAYVR